MPQQDKTLPVLEVTDLSVQLGGHSILHDVNLQVLPGTLHAILGPNGAGKTTLIRSLVGSLPHKGEICFRFQGNGTIGYVPQLLEFDHSLPLTVADFLAIMFQKKPVLFGLSKKTRRDILTCLERTSCGHLIDRLVGGLSGGELRRVLLAQALEPTPEILILDEPASNIDELGAKAFEKTLVDLCRNKGIAILMVGHDLATMLRIADFATGINGTVTHTGEASALRNPDVLTKIFGVQAFHCQTEEVIA